jgi:hypothetical protein
MIASSVRGAARSDRFRTELATIGRAAAEMARAAAG